MMIMIMMPIWQMSLIPQHYTTELMNGFER